MDTWTRGTQSRDHQSRAGESGLPAPRLPAPKSQLDGAVWPLSMFQSPLRDKNSDIVEHEVEAGGF